MGALFNELHIEQQNYESTKSRLYDLEEAIKETRVKLTNVFKNVISKVNSLHSKEDNKILITHEKNLSTINAIITNLENNIDQMDINELNDHLIWMKKIDAELKINFIKLYHFHLPSYSLSVILIYCHSNLDEPQCYSSRKSLK